MNSKKNKILITGSNGFLGQSLQYFFSSKKIDFLATGRLNVISQDYLYIDLDVESKVNCETVLKTYKPNIIINAAALTNVDECEQNKQNSLSVNTNSVLNFMSYCKDNHTHFVHISTDFVFDGLKGSYVEEDHCNPINYYGFCKHQAEKIIMEHLSSYTILRTSLIYGLDQKLNNFVSRVIKKLQKNITLNIVDDQYRTPTFVNDLCEVILKVIETNRYGLYHISSGEILSIYDIVCNIVKYCGLDINLINRIKSTELNQIASRPFNSSLIINKAINELDFQPTTLNNILK